MAQEHSVGSFRLSSDGRMKNISDKIHRLTNIEIELDKVASKVGMSYEQLSENIYGQPTEVLEAALVLITEKLALQKEIYVWQGGDLSNVVFLSSHR